VAVSREYAELRPGVEVVRTYQGLTLEIEGAEAMLSDPEMKELAEMELPQLRERLPAAEAAVKLALIPKDAADGKPALLEI
ncbi:MAG: PCRF domain-containing protein, partial [Octadecabacter sp.]